MERQIFRGEIYWAELKTAYVGESIQVGKRPVVIVSNEKNNKHSSIVNVLPITSQIDKKPLPVHALIEGCGLDKKSMALAEQNMPIPKTSLRDKIGECDEVVIARINDAIITQNAVSMPFDIHKVKRMIKDIIFYKHEIELYNKNTYSPYINQFKTYCGFYGYDFIKIFNKFKGESEILKSQPRLRVVSY